MVGISNNDSQRIISKVSNLLKLKKNHIKGMVNLVETNQIFQADKYIVKFSILDNLFNLIESIEFFNVELISESKFFLGRKFYGDLVMANSYVEIHN